MLESKRKVKMKPISTALPFAVAILGGIFFGQFSCGGYAWHKTLFKIIICVTITVCFIFNYRSLNIPLEFSSFFWLRG